MTNFDAPSRPPAGSPVAGSSDAEQLVAAVSMLAFASEIDGGVHSFEVEHDGDGWTEPFSDRYWCGCEENNPVWTLDWMQSDPECTGRPDPSAVLIAWAAHVDAAVTQPDDHPVFDCDLYRAGVPAQPVPPCGHTSDDPTDWTEHLRVHHPGFLPSDKDRS